MIEVLVVDDDARFTEVFVAFANQKNVGAKAAGDVAEARRLLEERPFQVILADWNLGSGREDGLTLLEFVHKAYPHARLCLVTGHKLKKPEQDRIKEIRADVVFKDDQIGTVLSDVLAGHRPSRPLLKEDQRHGVLGELQLRCEVLEAESSDFQSIIDLFIEDLVEELKKMPNKDAERIIAGTKRITVSALIDDLRTKTPRGLKIIRWYLGLNRLLRG